MNRYLLLIAAFLFAAHMVSAKNCASFESAKPGFPSTGLDALIEAELARDSFAGAVLLVRQAGKTLHRKAYGYAQKYSYGSKRLAEPESMTPLNLFDLASLTKVFATTFGIMLLVDKGALTLDTLVSRYIPAFAEGEKRKVTIGHLLGHRAGLPEWKPVYCHTTNRKDAIGYIAALPLKYKVNEAYHYSDLGFMLLGYVIETVTGTPLNVYLRDNLFAPLGLSHTAFRPLDRGLGPLAATSQGNPFEYRMIEDPALGYMGEEDPAEFAGWRHYTLCGEVNDGNAFYAFKGVAGHAGLFSRGDDLAVLSELLLEGGLYRGERIINSAVINACIGSKAPKTGLGWCMDLKRIHASGAPKGAFGHTGFTGVNALIVPRGKIVIILLTNRQNRGLGESGVYPNINGLRRKIAKEVFRFAFPDAKH